MEAIKFLFIALFLGFGLALLFCLLIALSYYLQCAWKWINDDPSRPRHNVVLMWMVKPFGFSPRKDKGYEKPGKHKEYDGFDVFWYPAVALILTPVTIAFTWFFYPITIAICLLFIMAHMARFGLRMKKVMQKHMADPDAHKKR